MAMEILSPYHNLTFPSDLPRELDRVAYRVAGLYFGLQEAASVMARNRKNPLTRTLHEEARRELTNYMEEIPDAGHILNLMIDNN